MYSIHRGFNLQVEYLGRADLVTPILGAGSYSMKGSGDGPLVVTGRDVQCAGYQEGSCSPVRTGLIRKDLQQKGRNEAVAYWGVGSEHTSGASCSTSCKP
jgi:hypothetical protein